MAAWLLAAVLLLPAGRINIGSGWLRGFGVVSVRAFEFWVLILRIKFGGPLGRNGFLGYA